MGAKDLLRWSSSSPHLSPTNDDSSTKSTIALLLAGRSALHWALSGIHIQCDSAGNRRNAAADLSAKLPCNSAPEFFVEHASIRQQTRLLPYCIDCVFLVVKVTFFTTSHLKSDLNPIAGVPYHTFNSELPYHGQRVI